MNTASLFIVGTPIGNTEDISLRALKTLSSVNTIICEDTRVTSKLLKRHGLEKKLFSYPSDFGKESGVIQRNMAHIIALLRDGQNLAFVSDAGMPGVSDPCAILVKKVRESLPNVKIECVPGPSAITSALSISGIYATHFNFRGFPPVKKGRTKFFSEILDSNSLEIFFESPHRILKTLKTMANIMPDRKAVVCRELTKIHEEAVPGYPHELLNYYENNSEKNSGEFVVIIEPDSKLDA